MLDQFVDLGVFDLAVSGGEPLSRPDIFEILEYGVNRGLSIGVGSNGSLVTDSVVSNLRGVGVRRLQISVDGLETTHDQARRWRGLFQIACDAIHRAVQAGLKVHVCMTVHRLNFHEMAEVIDMCAGFGVRRFNMSRFVPTGRGTAVLDLSPKEWRAALLLFERKRKEHCGRMEFTTHLAQLILAEPELACIDGFVGCQAGVGQGCVGPRGDVMPCVMLPITLGNIREQSFREIWSSSPTIRLLRDRQQLKGWCAGCAFRDKCGGCRAVAFSYTGDFLEADPRCWLYRTN
jgi:radical SAM protein with 4Fe4S-binding SPASM domain